jgi:ERCC4-type nuclease
MEVYVDTKEKKYVHNNFKKFLKKCKYKAESLVIGDFVVGNFVIERKTMNDLYKSIIKGNLYEQIRQLTEFRKENEEAIVIILIEYTKLSKENQRYNALWNVNQIMINIMQQFNIFVVKTRNIESTVNFINDIAIYETEDKKIIKRVRGFKRKKSLYDQKVFALSGFPTIGEVKSERILQNYDSLMDYFRSQEGKENQVSQVLFK